MTSSFNISDVKVLPSLSGSCFICFDFRSLLYSVMAVTPIGQTVNISLQAVTPTLNLFHLGTKLGVKNTVKLTVKLVSPMHSGSTLCYMTKALSLGLSLFDFQDLTVPWDLSGCFSCLDTYEI